MEDRLTILENKLAALEKRYEELNYLMAQPDVMSDLSRLQELAKEQARLQEAVSRYRHFREIDHQLKEARALLGDGSELAALAQEEVERLERQREDLWQGIKKMFLPRDPNDNKDIFVEIRAGTGGSEATLFAADLFRMYSRYAEFKGWEVEVISTSPSEVGGFKEIIFEVRGRGAFSRFKYERGVHRVQRVPVTEASGRIHTSTATVAVLAEAEEVEVDISPDDIRTDIFHSSGAGGQNVNKVATAVRITHVPTGIVVTCQDERSQFRNRTKAMAILRARLLELQEQQRMTETRESRRSQVGSGERAEKIRTYNFPQSRVTDHRAGISLYNLPAILGGEMDEMVDMIAARDGAEKEAALFDNETVPD